MKGATTWLVDSAAGKPMEVFNYPAWNLIAIERGSAAPLYQQLYAQLRILIVEGRIPRGARVPPSRMLSDELSISRNTVVLAYEKLATEGYLQRRIGSGTFVEQVFPEDHLPRRPRAIRGQSVLPNVPRRS